MNEAAIMAAPEGKRSVDLFDMEEAIDRVIAGPARKSRHVSQKEREIVAYHEAGHALVAASLEDADPVQKLSIVARGATGGYTRMIPDEDRSLWSKAHFEAMMEVMMGGQAVEELVFGDITTGASNDLQKATGVAKKMVAEYGMSRELGPRTFDSQREAIFLGKELGQGPSYSDAVAEKIDAAIGTLLHTAKERAKHALEANRSRLTTLAGRLLTDETIEGAELRHLLGGATAEAMPVAAD